MTKITHSESKPATAEFVDAPSVSPSGKETGASAGESTSTGSAPPTAPNSSGRLWVGTLVSAVVSTPLAWLLSYGATLPFFLGVFFFALFGLIAGAVVYRVASPQRPYSKSAVLVCTTMLVAFVFGFALAKESRDLPGDMANFGAKKTADLGGRTLAEFRADVAGEVRHYLRSKYAPGGTIGYVRWVLTNGKIARGNLPSVNADLVAVQTRVSWAMRVVFSIGLLSFGVASQTLGLYRVPGCNRNKANRVQP